ncbi:MAG: arsenate reductase ArsC [Candidatus Bathyarchaeia archaeon]
MKKILFVCVENAGRSQMAEAFANAYGSGKVVADSAGTVPADKVNSTVVQAMWEKGLDLSRKRPKLLTAEKLREADVVVTMGCGVAEVCPSVFVENIIDWKLDDPKNQPIQRVREIRDEVEKLVKELVEKLTS